MEEPNKNKNTQKPSAPRVPREDQAPTFDELMRRLKHVKSSGPYTRDEMNER